MDNSPRFANRNVTRIGDMKDLAAIDLSSYMALQNETLARMAEALDLPDEAAEFKNKGEELNRLVNDLLWDEGSGLYYDRDMKKNELIKIKTIAGLVPLFCGVPDPERARKLRDHVMDPAEFNTPMPLPSVARNDPAFEKDMWRGPVWINTSYMVILGLERYGFGAEAAELSFRTADGVYRNYNLTGGFYEYYDPDHDGIEELGRKNSPYKKLSGADKPKPHFVGWTGLVNTLVIEHVLGVQNTANGWKACPNIFRGDDMVFVLNLSAEKLSLEVRAPSPDKVSGKMTAGKRCEEFDIDAGSCFILPLQ
jgi:neutral trehalase